MSPQGESAPLEFAFLIGCARSGTSVLGEALAAHPRIAYLYEVSSVWRKVFADRPDDRLTAADAGDRTQVEELRRALARLRSDPERHVLLEKNPKHTLRVAFLERAFPGCRVVHTIRDGRDTTASLMFRNRGARWGHLKIPGWEDLLARYPKKNHIRCAWQWRDSVRLARQEGRRMSPERYREIRFEKLVEDPVTVVSEVLEFFGLTMTDSVGEAAERIQDETAGSYHARRQVRHYVDNHARRVGRYRENLTEEQIREILEVSGDLLEELGYLARGSGREERARSRFSE